MINFLKLRNFQRHRLLKMRLERITTIIGRTDAGKSAILRALRWLVLNDIAGTGFIRHGRSTASVIAKIDGHTIKRIRGRKDNRYVVDGKTSRAFGQDVPLHVQRIIRTNEINFQRQHDSPFWFAASAGQVSRELNRVIDLGVIDTSLAKAASHIREASERKNVVETRLDGISHDLEEISPQRKRIEEFKRLHKQHDQLKSLKDRCHRLASIIEAIDSYSLETLEQRSRHAQRLLGMANRAGEISESRWRINHIIQQVENLPKLRTRLDMVRDWQECFHHMDKVGKAREKLSHHIDRILSQSFALDALQARMKAADNRLKKVKHCPLCRQKIKTHDH